jgi:hypothetical protein
MSEAAAPERTADTTAIQDVIAERERQMAIEGWTPEHDDKHNYGEMAEAAACYLMGAGRSYPRPPQQWPWLSKWWKPKDRRRDLVRAAALVIAEIERLDRASSDTRKAP